MLLVLTLGTSIAERRPQDIRTAAISLRESEKKRESPKPDEPDEPLRPAAQAAAPRTVSQPVPDPAPDPTPQQAPPPPALIPVTPRDMASSDIAKLPRAAPATRPATGAMGPVDSGPRMADTARVGGSGPGGQPLYAAAWYREPYNDELRGYLSTATGPGWGLIACRTVPDFRVEDCVKVDEYPAGSNIARAVLAAAWQFRVRPPRIGGQPQVGEWVRIRIDYDLRRSNRPQGR